MLRLLNLELHYSYIILLFTNLVNFIKTSFQRVMSFFVQALRGLYVHIDIEYHCTKVYKSKVVRKTKFFEVGLHISRFFENKANINTK